MSNTILKQRPESSLFVSGGNEFSLDGSDLYFSGEPDDILIARERIALLQEDPEANQAAVLAETVVLEVMEAYHEDEGVFHPHGEAEVDKELRAYLFEQMRGRVATILGPRAVTIASDSWLSDRLAFVRGFPPYRYDDEEE